MDTVIIISNCYFKSANAGYVIIQASSGVPVAA